MNKATELILACSQVDEGAAVKAVLLIAAWLSWATQIGALPKAEKRVRERIVQVFKIKDSDPLIDQAISKFKEK